MHISITERMENWVREKVDSGLYSNASEVIREALRSRMEDDDEDAKKLAALRAAILPAIEQADRGELVEFNLDDFLQELDSEAENIAA